MDFMRLTKRGAVLAALALLWLPVSSLGDLEHDLAARRAKATDLRAAIAAETKRIEATNESVANAQERLAGLQQQVTTREAELASVQHGIVNARNHLSRLENRLHAASTALAANLVASYKDQEPDVVTVVLESHGFADMLERLQFMERIRKHDARVVGNTKTARREVLAETARLQKLLVRNQELVAQVREARDRAAAVQGALLTRRADQLQSRSSREASLARVRAQVDDIRKQLARSAARQRTAATQPNPNLPVNPGGMAQAPAGAPAAVKQVIAAGNAIAGLPYLWGGGHGSFNAQGYDCSGSVSYALAAAGLLSSPLDSTGFMSWGEAGPGKWITVYANSGHAFMVVAGWRFDTSALSGGGTRWTRAMRSTAGFVARHPAGF
jgi:cell wall-associated NlpC family hydrolase